MPLESFVGFVVIAPNLVKKRDISNLSKVDTRGTKIPEYTMLCGYVSKSMWK